MHSRGTRVTWDRPGLTRGVGTVEQSREAHGERIMYQIRDDRGNVFWFDHGALVEANL